MTSSYQIKQWGSWIGKGNQTTPLPIIYIKPNLELIQFCKKNGNNLNVFIDGTNSEYDKKAVSGVFTQSDKIPNYRPNFLEETGWYVIVLNAPFIIFPKMSNGFVKIYGFSSDIPQPITPLPSPESPSPSSFMVSDDSTKKHWSITQIVGISVASILGFIILLLLLKKIF